MPFSPLDALMPIASARTTEPLRTDAAPPFQPALERAYQAETPRPAPPPSPAEAPREREESPTAGQQDDSDERAEAATPAEGAANRSSTEESTEEESAANDEVEVSAEAAAAARVVQAAKAEKVVEESAADGQSEEHRQTQAFAASAPGDQETNDSGVTETGDALPAEKEGKTPPVNENLPTNDGKEVKTSLLHSTHGGESQHKKGSNVEAEEAKVGAADSDVAPSGSTAEVANVPAPTDAVDPAAGSGRDTTRQSPSDEAATKNASPKPSTVVAEAVSPATSAPASGDGAPISASMLSDVASAAPAAEATPAPSGETPRSAAALDRLMGGPSSRLSEAGDPNGMPTVDRARFVQRVEGAMKAAHQRDGKIQVRLSPPDLGSVKIELAVQNGVLSAKLEAETPAARNLLLDSLPALRERLAQQDIRVDKFDVDVRDDRSQSGGRQGEERTDNQSGQRQEGRARPNPSQPVLATAGSATRATPSLASAASGLDVRV